jgi:GDP-mannose 6-dehydrogenase
VNLAKIIGANKNYIEKEIPHISSLMKNSIDDVLDHADLILISNKGSGFGNALRRLRPGQQVLDLVRITEDWKSLNGSYEGIGW